MKSSFAFIGILSLMAVASCQQLHGNRRNNPHHGHHHGEIEEVREEVQDSMGDIEEIKNTLKEADTLADTLEQIEKLEDFSNEKKVRQEDSKQLPTDDENNIEMMRALLKDIVRKIPDEKLSKKMKKQVIRQTMSNVHQFMSEAQHLSVDKRWQLVMSHIQKIAADNLTPELAAELNQWMRPENFKQFENIEKMLKPEDIEQMTDKLEQAGFTPEKLSHLAEESPEELKEDFQTIMETFASGSEQSKAVANELQKMWQASVAAMEQEAEVKSHPHHQPRPASHQRPAQHSAQQPAHRPAQQTAQQNAQRPAQQRAQGTPLRTARAQHSGNVFNRRPASANYDQDYHYPSRSPYWPGHPSHGQYQPLAQAAY